MGSIRKTVSWQHPVIICLVCLLLAACSTDIGRSRTPDPSTPTGKAVVEVPSSDADLDARVDDLLSKMTLEEKIGQMTQVEKLSISPEHVSEYYIGSILHGGGYAPTPNTPEKWVEMVREYQEAALSTRLGIPLIYGLDAIHGFASLYGATIFPQPIGLGATRNPDLVRQIGRATAEEMIAVGVPWNFAPIVAVPQDIRWGRTYESYGEDTTVVAEMGAAFVMGMQSVPSGLETAEGQALFALATPKHFLGDGGTTFGTSKMMIDENFYLLDQGDMQYSEEEIRKLFLPAYKAAVEAGAKSIMVSFSSWNGVKMHAQRYWITDVLKGELGFDGFVVSDWGGIDQVAAAPYISIVTSINAGIDMSMVPYDYRSFIKNMKLAVKNGDIPIERIDDAVHRILKVKFELGLFENPFADGASLPVIGSQEHRALARKAVSESLVLLKNDKDALPIPEGIKTIYIAGVAADDIGIQCGGWTTTWQGEAGDVQPGTTILEAVQGAVPAETQVAYDAIGGIEGMADYGIAVVGEYPYAEGFGDKEDLSLSGYDIQVIENLREHSRVLVVIIISGRPVIITDQYLLADAWVAAWLPGTEGEGVTDGLFGSTPFTGRLPYTWPRFNSQLPLNINNSSKLKGCDAPLFPYGYGLGEVGSKPIKWLDCVEED